ncbi:DUF3667 domain-containing protein [Owenweeksia hongkongensis]|uniref:DUF3667 domain-containing protein n=1 Tax=Owenweeksia hongkongensis TaxID=253245 RepID=UPI003A90AE80
MKNNTCKNCKIRFEGNYCANCGQAASANNRLKFTTIFKEFFDNTFNIHKGFFFTFWKLCVKPSEVALSYIQGSRKKYTNPTRYLVIALAILGFLQFWANTQEAVSSEDFQGFIFLPEELNRSMSLWDLKLITEWTLLGNLLEALVFPIGFYWLFRQLKYNYSELLTLSFYLISNSIFITILLVGIPKALTNAYAPVLFVVSVIMVYYIYALTSFYKAVPIVKRMIFILFGLAIFFLIRFLIIPFILALLFPLSTP